MKNFRRVLIRSFFLLLLSLVSIANLLSPTQVYAVDNCADTYSIFTDSFTVSSNEILNGDIGESLSISLSGFSPGLTYNIYGITVNPNIATSIKQPLTVAGGKATIMLTDPSYFYMPDYNLDQPWLLHIEAVDSRGDVAWDCAISESFYTIKKAVFSCAQLVVSQDRSVDVDGDGVPDMCHQTPTNGGCIDATADIVISGYIYKGNQPSANHRINTDIGGAGGRNEKTDTTAADGSFSVTYPAQEPDTYRLRVEGKTVPSIGFNICNLSDFIRIKPQCDDAPAGGLPPECSITKPPAPLPGQPPGPVRGAIDSFSFCSQINDPALKIECLDCAGGEKGYAGVWTAIGCIKREPEAIVRKFMVVGISTGGGVALLSFLAAGFTLSTSQGDAKRIDDAKQLLTASITGLLFIIFSVTILEYIGYSILGIPGFGG